MPSEPEKLKLVSVDVVYYEKYMTYVAECMELPIVMEADTIAEIKQKMPVAVDTYRKLYPALSENALKTEMTISTKPPDEKVSGKTFIKMAIPAT